jgi:hypothetical protein
MRTVAVLIFVVGIMLGPNACTSQEATSYSGRMYHGLPTFSDGQVAAQDVGVIHGCAGHNESTCVKVTLTLQRFEQLVTWSGFQTGDILSDKEGMSMLIDPPAFYAMSDIGAVRKAMDQLTVAASGAKSFGFYIFVFLPA